MSALPFGSAGVSSGYTYCHCRDCMEILVSNDMTSPDFCDNCTKAGCPDYQGVKGMSQECQSPDTYGGDNDGSHEGDNAP